MKIKLTVVIMAAIFLCGCSKEINDKQDCQLNYIVAESPSNDSKTTLINDSGINRIFWKEGDQIDVIGETESPKESHIYTIFNGVGTTIGKFGSSNPCPDQTLVFASYPKGSWLSDSNHSYYYLTIPFEQLYAPSNAQDGIIPMYAQGSPTNLSFNHISAIFRVKAYNASGLSISMIEMNATENIAGVDGIVFKVVTSKPDQVMSYGHSIRSSKGKTRITLNCDGIEIGKTAETATEFNFVVFANDNSTGYKISDLSFTFYDANSQKSFTVSKTTDKTYYAGKIYSFPPVNCIPVFTGIKIYVDGVENDWDNISVPNESIRVVSTTQKLTANMLSSINDVINASSNDNIVLDLSEAEYINNYWGEEVRNNNKISVIKLPANIERLVDVVLFNYHLSEVHFPAALSSMGGGQTFNNTAADIFVDSDNETYSNNAEGWLISKNGYTLERIPNGKQYPTLTIPEGIKQLRSYFYQDDFDAMTKIVLPSTLQSIDAGAFINQYGLDTIDCSNTIAVPDWNCGGSVTPVGKKAVGNRRIIVPDSLLESYQNAGLESGWYLLPFKFSTNPWTYVSDSVLQGASNAELPNLSLNTDNNHPFFWK